MNWHIISAGITVVFSFAIGVFVYIKNPRSNINKFFCILTFCGGIWALADVVVSLSPTDEIALLWNRLLYWVGFFIPLFFAKLIFSILRIENDYKKLYKYSFFIIFILTILNCTPLFMKSVTRSPFREEVGPLYFLFILYSLGLILYSLYKLFVNYIKMDVPLKRMQLKCDTHAEELLF